MFFEKYVASTNEIATGFRFHVSDGRYEGIDTVYRQYSGQEKAYRGTPGFGETAPGHGACR